MDKEVSSLKHLFVTVFLSNFAIMVVNPAIIDITMDAICPSQDKCSLAIYLSGFQQAADCMPEGKRASAIGIVAGVGSAAFVCSTFAVRFLSTAQIFLVSSISSSAAAIYMTIFLEDSNRHINTDEDPVNQPILLANNANECTSDSSPKNIPPFYHVICLLKSSTTLLLATAISFLYGLAEGGIQTPFLLILVPRLAPIIGEETILCLALIAGFSNMLIDSIAWVAWVPYVVALFPMFLFLAKPAGIAQGCISGISSFANILSPFIYSPLTVVSDDLYNVYSGTKTSKELWGALERKYKTEDAGIKKFLVAWFLDFKMIDSKSVVSQVQELQVIIHDLLVYGIFWKNTLVEQIKNVHNTHINFFGGLIVNDAFQVAAIVEKLPPLWKDFKNYLKHKHKEMTVEDLIVRLRIEEDSKAAERRSKGNSTMNGAHIVESGQNNSKKRKKVEHGSNQPKKKFKGKGFNCGKIDHKSTDC
ncbi:putative DDB1- and CUL4-associated factor 8-like isoform X1 [Capsicum annuum]|nr:putative DDB1- and CUL4-associated factor 8-like isoform X1 [Capsicum annuum]